MRGGNILDPAEVNRVVNVVLVVNVVRNDRHDHFER